MKKYKTLIVLVIVLAVFVGLYFLVNVINEKQAEKELETDVMVTNLSELKTLKYTDGKTTLSFIKEKDNWYKEDDKEFKVKNIKVNSMEDSLTDIVAVREIKTPDSLEDYELENPKYTITMKDKDGKEAVVYIGKQVGENYYATVNDKKVVYIVEGVVVETLEFDLTVLTETEVAE